MRFDFILFYFHFILFKKITDLNLLANFEKLKSESVKDKVLVIVFWINNKIKPIPNSTADKTKKKKVKDKTLIQSNIKPIINEIAYNVIHKISAVNNKWIDVFVLIKRLKKIKKKNKNKIFKLSTIINKFKIYKKY